MKRPTPETYRALDEVVHSKDKRTLVLFLFGLLALAPHFLPTAQPEQVFFYGLLPEKAGQSWQIIKAPKVQDSDASTRADQWELAEWTESLPLEAMLARRPGLSATFGRRCAELAGLGESCDMEKA